MAESLPPNSIFMCYRRSDSEEMVDRIYDTLAQEFGEAAIFRDIDNIPAGVDFPTYIQESLRDCPGSLIFIGREWANCSDARGRQRIADPGDHVRIEVETALALPGSRVIPVFVKRAEMPGEDELPESLQPLRRRNGLTVRSSGFDYKNDVAHLGKILETAVLQVLTARQAAVEEQARQQWDQGTPQAHELAEEQRLEEAAAEAERRHQEARAHELEEQRRLAAAVEAEGKRQYQEARARELPDTPSHSLPLAVLSGWSRIRSQDSQTRRRPQVFRFVFSAGVLSAVLLLAWAAFYASKHPNPPFTPTLAATGSEAAHVDRTSVPPPSVPPASLDATSPVPVVANTTASATPSSRLPSQPESGNLAASLGPQARGIVEIVVSKKMAYVSEIIPVEIRLYVDSRVRWQPVAMPELSGEGFTKQKMPEPNRPEQVTKNGIEYDLMIFKTAITPGKAGKISIGPAEIIYNAQVPRAQPAHQPSPIDLFGNHILGDTMFAQTQQIKAKGEAVELIVKPLPASGKPRGG